MLERAEELKQRVRETPLSERLTDARRRIGKMCSEGRPPHMTIPVQYDDDDFYISTTLSDAQATIADLQGQAKDYQACRDVLDSTVLELTQVQQRVAQLESLKLGKEVGACEHCLYCVWESCAQNAPNAIEMKCSNGSTWWRCGYCRMKADHARVLGLLAQVTEIADMMLKGTECEHDVGLCSCEHRRIVKQAQRSLPAQPVLGGKGGGA